MKPTSKSSSTFFSAKTNPTVLIGEDTDFLILLCYHADPDGEDLFFMGARKKASISAKVWNIKRAKFSLGKDVCATFCSYMPY